MKVLKFIFSLLFIFVLTNFTADAKAFPDNDVGYEIVGNYDLTLTADIISNKTAITAEKQHFRQNSNRLKTQNFENIKSVKWSADVEYALLCYSQYALTSIFIKLRYPVNNISKNSYNREKRLIAYSMAKL